MSRNDYGDLGGTGVNKIAILDPNASQPDFMNSEDGKLYRWDLTTNHFTESMTLTGGVLEAYTPTVVGSDGAAYAINRSMLFAVGASCDEDSDIDQNCEQNSQN